MSTYTVAKLPVLALRGMSIFPEQTVHFDVGRLKSALALEHAMKHDQVLFLVPQKDILVDDPGLKDLHAIGTVVKVKQILKTQGDNVRVLVTGLYRARILELTQNEPFLSGTIDPVDEVTLQFFFIFKVFLLHSLLTDGTILPLNFGSFITAEMYISVGENVTQLVKNLINNVVRIIISCTDYIFENSCLCLQFNMFIVTDK